MAIVLALDLMLHFLPNQTSLLHEMRERKSEYIAVQVAVQARTDETRPLLKTLHAAMAGDAGIASIAIRRVTGEILAVVGDHARNWALTQGQRSSLDNVRVPLLVENRKWGDVEISFQPTKPLSLIGWIQQPKVLLIGLLTITGFILFSLYLRRVLQHLDPSSVIPDRVRRAFDSFTEGVMIVDPAGRIMLANSAFRSWLNKGNENLHGRHAHSLSGLRDALPADTKEHPWMVAMSNRRAEKGEYIEFKREGGEPIKTMVNCDPIQDERRSVRGCIVSFNDVTDLEVMNRDLTAAMRELEHSRAQIEKQNEELRRLATRDPLTGCLNRRAFYEQTERLFIDAKASGRSVCCIMTDIDHFKIYNDRFGHAVGDAILQAIARCLYSGLRDSDLLCRYGGEEFCIIVADMSLDGARRTAERLRSEIETRTAKGLRNIDTGIVTSSFGLASLSPDINVPAELIDRADQALYAAKRSGRNRVEIWESERPTVSV
ncbi:MAG: sensor domain-containing diguanylate cyclase [Betaproteobacteria bacterium]